MKWIIGVLIMMIALAFTDVAMAEVFACLDQGQLDAIAYDYAGDAMLTLVDVHIDGYLDIGKSVTIQACISEFDRPVTFTIVGIRTTDKISPGYIPRDLAGAKVPIASIRGPYEGPGKITLEIIGEVPPVPDGESGEGIGEILSRGIKIHCTK